VRRVFLSLPVITDGAYMARTCWPILFAGTISKPVRNHPACTTLSDTTEAVHLWHHMGTNTADYTNPIQPGSFLDQAFRMVDMSVEAQ
jgi:hypothetical protein